MIIPNAEHKIFFLHTDLETLYDRWKNKKWYDKKYTIKTVETWLKNQLKMIRELENFEIIALDSSDKNYEARTFSSIMEKFLGK